MRPGLFGLTMAAGFVCAAAFVCATWGRSAPATGLEQGFCSPSSLAATKDGRTVYVACATGARVAVLDTEKRRIVGNIAVPSSPTGLALASNGLRLYVTCGLPSNSVVTVDLAMHKVTTTMPAGHTPMGPLLSPDSKLLFVCNRFSNSISAFDLQMGKQAYEVRVAREPVAAAITPDGKLLFAANHLPTGRSDAEVVAAQVSVIDTAARKVIGQIALPNGSTALQGIRISPDGKFACITHLLGHFALPTIQLDRGWMETNALSILDVRQRRLENTVLLDNLDRGAANPWALEWSSGGRSLWVTHAGTHEVSVVDFPALLRKLERASASEAPSDMSLLLGIRDRVSTGGSGPRALALAGSKVYVANYFSDTVSVIDADSLEAVGAAVALSRNRDTPLVRRGEMLFNDASLCFQGWQTCASCHSADGRVDGLNWDLLNDGIGNPKNVKSLLLSHETPPAMSLGVRETAEVAVRAGIRASCSLNLRKRMPQQSMRLSSPSNRSPVPTWRMGSSRKPRAGGKSYFWTRESAALAAIHQNCSPI